MFKKILIVFLIGILYYPNCYAQNVNVTYHTPNIFVNGTMISDLHPVVTGGSISSYSVSPNLPEGLNLNISTGIISGTPTKNTPETEFNIVAKTSKSTSKTAVVKIAVNPAIPNISYNSEYIFMVGSTINEVKPTNNGGIAKIFSIAPNLPLGLKLNPSSGAITGIPLSVSETLEYTILAANESGISPPTKLKITINKSCSNCSFEEIISLIGIFLICIVIIGFLLFIILKSKKDKNEALGLPSGSIRAIIALLFVVFFMLLAVIFYFDSDTTKRNTDLSKQIITILGTLVTAVSAFYFGSKSTEQAQANTVKALKDNVEQNNQEAPPYIIQEAIQKNLTNWKNKYGCEDIRLGKKITQDTAQNIDCIVFTVVSKEGGSGKIDIPSTFSYTSNGITYNIPTDVVSQQVKIVLSLDSNVNSATATPDMLKGDTVKVTVTGANTPVSVVNNHDGTFTATIISAGIYTITARMPVNSPDLTTLIGTLTVSMQPGNPPITLKIK